jgi:DNA-3-methyladenine glycosylase II
MRKAIVHLKKADPVLSAVIEKAGPYRIEYRDPDFAALARAIVSQQLSGRVAQVIIGRLLDATKELTPENVLRLRPAKLRSVGLSQQKASYLRDLAKKTRAGELEFERIPEMPDDEVVEHLTKVKGIGMWTAHMFLIFALRRPDVLPTGDLGIRVAMKNQYGLEALPRPAEMEEIARPWRPFCSVASWYLWRSLEKD